MARRHKARRMTERIILSRIYATKSYLKMLTKRLAEERRRKG